MEDSPFVFALLLVLFVLPLPVIIWTWRKGPWGKDIKFVISSVVFMVWLMFFFFRTPRVVGATELEPSRA